MTALNQLQKKELYKLLNKSLQCIGLAKKAGKLKSGTQNVLEAVRTKKAVSVLIASDASFNTKKLISDKTAFYSINAKVCKHTVCELGEILGVAACACVAFTDNSFALMYEQATEQ